MSPPTKEELAEMPEFILSYMAPMMGPGRPYAEELIRRRNKEQAKREKNAIQTKEQFLTIMRRELSKHEWAKDEARLRGAMESVEKTLNGSRTCVIDSPSWTTAWKEIGMKGKPTYRGLYALAA